jgi:hypothetical protein
LNEQKPDFAVNLGDIIEGNCPMQHAERDLDAVLNELKALDDSIDLFHVVGNHCLQLPRPYLHAKLSLPDVERAYFSFVRAGYRFIILDTLEISLKGTVEGSSKRLIADVRMLCERLFLSFCDNFCLSVENVGDVGRREYFVL